MQQKKTLFLGLLIAMIVELGFTTWWRKQWGDHWSPIVLLLAGLAVCWLSYRMIAFRENVVIKIDNPKTRRNRLLFVAGVFAIGAIVVGIFYAGIMQKFPVHPDGTGSDVIPSLMLYVQRFLAGEYPYQPLEFAGWTVLPTYFPMMWLPYCFSEILQIDYRWTAYLVFLAALFAHQYRMAQQDIPILEVFVKTLLPFLYLWILMESLDTVFGYGVELMPIGIYFFLTLTLLHRSAWLVALPIVCVLLSRYAFTFWLPVYLLIIWIERGFWDVFKIGIWVIVGVLFLYIIPFLSKDWEIFFNGLKYYGKTAETSWAWVRDDGRPVILIEGFSTAIFFYDFAEGELLERLKVNRMVHIGVCFLAAITLLGIYLKNRSRNLNVKLFLLIGLKFYLVIFYGFFYVPFKYLFLLPLLLGIPIIYQIPFFKNNQIAR